ncbi:hypothetical protein CI238_12765 [Colletotrichum incanum]|uniref:Uncharacterized protein n=1 Tax=Colletotrichum incanum TaxID=1573173 RepID=A0A166LRY3_COLIC|nr:hypothetical protein CI238_12765 [Colletotrichum incanum]
MKNLLCSSRLICRRLRDGLVFRYANRSVLLPKCMLFSTRCSSDPLVSVLGPSIAYLQSTAITAARERSLQHVWKPRFSPPTWSLYKLRLARLTPPDAARDPYIAAVLIAMAQEQQMQQRSLAPSASHAFCVHVLLGNANDNSHIRVYTAAVTGTFLDKLTDPLSPSDRTACFQIYTIALPYEPFSTFQERVVRIMFPCGRKRKIRMGDGAGDEQR